MSKIGDDESNETGNSEKDWEIFDVLVGDASSCVSALDL